MIQGAIFDMDGLMFDTERLSTEGWLKAGNVLNFPITKEFLDQFRGTNIPHQKARYKEVFGESFDYDGARAIRTEYIHAYFREHGVPIKKGLLELLNWLTAQGIPCAVATSTKREFAEQYLRQAGVYHFFSYMIYGDMVQISKPNPEIFLKAAEGLHCAPENCVVFEDSTNGILAGEAAGMSVIGIPDMVHLDGKIRSKLWACLPDLKEAVKFLEKHKNEQPQMKVTAIGHSGFLVELDCCSLLFDYYIGEIPEVSAEVPLYVFSSHSHGDHYNPEIWKLREKYPQVNYVLSKDIRRKVKDPGENVVFMPIRTDWTDGLIRVQTLQSTDVGAAFLVDVGETRIYHSGDLNWWTWEGEETEQEYRHMTGNWKHEMKCLQQMTADKEIDLAFMLLDPRQGSRYGWGMTDFLKQIPVRYVLPMHSQGDYDIAIRYLSSEEGKQFRNTLLPLYYDGQVLVL